MYNFKCIILLVLSGYKVECTSMNLTERYRVFAQYSWRNQEHLVSKECRALLGIIRKKT